MKFSKLPLVVFLTALFIICAWYVGANAGLLGFELKNQNISSQGIYLGASVVRNYAEPLNGFQPNNVNLTLGWQWKVYGLETNIIPLQMNLGTESQFKFGLDCRYYLTK